MPCSEHPSCGIPSDALMHMQLQLPSENTRLYGADVLCCWKFVLDQIPD